MNINQRQMKYRVKFKCYWYNTGAADNHYYINYEEFDTFEEAQAFEKRVIEQHKTFSDNSEGWVDRHDKWKKSENFIEVENGFITGDSICIVKHFPEREEALG